MENRLIANLSLFSGAHALVDASCAALLFDLYKNGGMEPEGFAFPLLLYNVLAFALQAPVGFLADRLKRPYGFAASGCLLVIAAMPAAAYPPAAVCLAGLGNALFHVGGGIVSLKIRPGKASIPGIYVAPGAFGLFLGTLVGSRGLFTAWPFMLLLLTCASAILLLGRSDALRIRGDGASAPGQGTRPFAPAVLGCSGALRARGDSVSAPGRGTRPQDLLEPVLLLMAAAIALRALTGFALDFPWKADAFLLTGLTLAVVLGKGLGGILADRFGWTAVAVAGLLLSAPLLLLGFGHPFPALLGVFLFNMTMPVTLAVISDMLPGMEGFAFGLSTLAIISGSFPMFTELKHVFYNKGVILAAVLVSAAMVYAGLRLYFRAVDRVGGRIDRGVGV